MGSVKDLEVIQKPTQTAMGLGRFHFSDRYSVFDWGEMPDQIEGKGQALCLMGAYCFERLEEKGVKTHYRGLVNSDGEVVKFKELRQPSNTMEVSLVNVYKPETQATAGKLKYNYSFYTPKLRNCLIPLEIIYRNGLPEGSSVFKRLEQGKTTLKDLGLDHHPKPGEHFTKPLFDVSTKLEQTDRYVTWEDAKKIAGLTNLELIAVKTVLSKVDDAITEMACHAKLENEDGKIELAFDEERKLIVVDVVGTLDECRFTYEGFHVSKEIARQFYKKTSWFMDVEEATKAAEAKGITDWKSLCKSQPPKLDAKLKTFISQMYMAAANELTNRKFFDVPSLAKIINDYKKEKGEKA
ncbi:MAG TPA: phosphoribosylaminoimidazolesuccinocarboxamide synthase [Candidatus Bathyarchaeia archaeon]|nr:phosphoribosylaminoimidazolesuccinocarboxamide synthase [Candidatus Bathyarchaeia archaeon]